MPFSPDAIANYFLELAEERGDPITPLKLQKLMYFAHGWHLALEPSSRPLVAEDLQAWDYGPVFPSTYTEFRDFGGNPITRRALEFNFTDQHTLQLFVPTVEDEAKQRECNPAFSKAVMTRVWEVYGPRSATALSELTHERGSPWWKVREEAKKKLKGRIPRGLNIPNPLIRDWFKARFRTPAA